MTYLLVRHKVGDYKKWRPFFDGHGVVRESTGSKGGKVFRNASNPNEVFILFKWDSVEKAKQFSQLDDLKETMEKAGVSDKPDIYFLEEAEEVDA